MQSNYGKFFCTLTSFAERLERCFSMLYHVGKKEMKTMEEIIRIASKLNEEHKLQVIFLLRRLTSDKELQEWLSSPRLKAGESDAQSPQ